MEQVHLDHGSLGQVQPLLLDLLLELVLDALPGASVGSLLLGPGVVGVEDPGLVIWGPGVAAHHLAVAAGGR